ncbi:hypothetical protein E2C01_062438 [Portunus trituberculatus]|uniref:Double-strand break repair protein MRE11 n=1 Tax=Portunus trituberculatus TaxID=210409 RepID=A0A5B7H7V8_PORTR|nr:hypothetical protein [Portunus trituberculatus]
MATVKAPRPPKAHSCPILILSIYVLGTTVRQMREAMLTLIMYSGGVMATEDDDSFRILVATDTHLGYAEKHPERGKVIR